MFIGTGKSRFLFGSFSSFHLPIALSMQLFTLFNSLYLNSSLTASFRQHHIQLLASIFCHPPYSTLRPFLSI